MTPELIRRLLVPQPAAAPAASPAGESSTIKAEEIAKLWMNENSIVNTKVAYFTAVNAALAAAVGGQKDTVFASHATWLCAAGVLISLAAFFSISRTCAYRKRLRRLLDTKPGYSKALTCDFLIHEKLRSNILLTITPLCAAAGWAFLYNFPPR